MLFLTIYYFYSSTQDGKVKDMPTMDIQVEKEIMIPEGREEVETQEDCQEEKIQPMTLMMKTTPQMVKAPQVQAVTIQVNHTTNHDPNFQPSTTSH